MSDLPPNGLRIESSSPPPTRERDSAPATPKPNKNTQVNLIIAGLEKTYSAVGMGLMLVNSADAQIIASNAHELAESWRGLLETNAKVRAQFLKMLESSGWSTVIMTHLMVALPIIKNHKASFEHLTSKGDDAKRVRHSGMGPTPATSTL